MGGSSSKAAKQATKEATRASAAAPAQGSARVRPPTSQAPPSETKDAAIMQDGKDPSLIQNLASLGQVNVPRRPGQPQLKMDRRMLDILDKRRQNEEQLEKATSNVMSASSLAILLDERKRLGRTEFEALVKEYGIDIGIIDRLSRHVNTPSVTSVRTQKEELEEVQVARWVDEAKEDPARIGGGQ